MENKAVAVMGYPDRLNKYRLNTNRTSLANSGSCKTKEKPKQQHSS